jgi:hypothetical protein
MIKILLATFLKWLSSINQFNTLINKLFSASPTDNYDDKQFKKKQASKIINTLIFIRIFQTVVIAFAIVLIVWLYFH